MKDISSDALRIESLKAVERTEIVIKEFEHFNWTSLARLDWSEYEIEGLGPARVVVLEHNDNVFLLQYLEVGEVLALMAVPPVTSWFEPVSANEINEMVQELGLSEYETFNNEFYFSSKNEKIQAEKSHYSHFDKHELRQYLQLRYCLSNDEVESLSL